MLPVLFKVGPLPISTFGVLFTIGFIFAVFYIFSVARRDLVLIRHSVDEEAILDIVIATSFFGLLGARILHILSNFQPFGFDLLRWILFPYFPGLSLMGGVLGSLAFLIFFCRKKRLPLKTILDIATLGFLLASPFSFLGVFLKEQVSQLPIYSMQAFLYFSLFFVFILLKKKRVIRRDGVVALTFFCIFAIVTFGIEFVRFDRQYVVFLTANQWISIFLAAISFFFLIRLKKEPILHLLKKNKLIW